MAIKRVTFEIDDIDDLRSMTNTPLQRQFNPKGVINDQTKSIEDYKDAEISKSDNLNTSKPTIGRTIADLVVEFKNDARVMTTLLVVVSFLLFINKLDSINKFIYPLLLSIILNIVWYSIPYLQKRFFNKINA